MITLAIASQKPGAGKTTLALNLAHVLAARGWRTLLVDVDPHGWVGLSLRRRPRNGEGLLDLLARGESLYEASRETRMPGLHILAADEETLAATVGPTQMHISDEQALGRLLAQAAPSCDLAIFDTPSGILGPTRAALQNSDYALVPVPAEASAGRSVDQTVDAINALRDQGSRIELLGFVLSMVDWRSELSVKVARETRRSLPVDSVFSVIPRDPVFLQASAYGVPLALLGARPPAVAAVFEELATALEERWNQVRVPTWARSGERAETA